MCFHLNLHTLYFLVGMYYKIMRLSCKVFGGKFRNYMGRLERWEINEVIWAIKKKRRKCKLRERNGMEWEAMWKTEDRGRPTSKWKRRGKTMLVQKRDKTLKSSHNLIIVTSLLVFLLPKIHAFFFISIPSPFVTLPLSCSFPLSLGV